MDRILGGGAIGEYKHGWSRRGHKRTEENRQTGLSMNQSGIKNKINPTGQDGQILKCKSCGSFRHLLDACPHSWENMAKKNADVKPLNQDDAEKTRGDRTQLDLEELTAELNSIKKQITTLKKDIRLLKADKNNAQKNNAQKRKNEEMQCLELNLEQEKQTRIRFESIINELQQEILKLEAEKMQFSEEIESATFQAKMVVTNVEKEMLLLLKCFIW